jgi:hypothetical protein
MIQNRLTIKLLAIVSIILLSQKFGFGIYFHNSQHVQVANTKCDEHSVDFVNFHCSCIDNFSMPFTETALPEIAPAINFESLYLTTEFQSYSNSFHCFNSLRAPPVREF